MLDVEPLIVEELASVAALDTFDGLDWGDAMTRAHLEARRSPWLRAALVAAAVFAIAAPALAFRNQVIAFFSAPHAPRPAVVMFGQMQVTSFPAAAPGVLPHQARLILRRRTDSGVSTLSVAPTRDGGYCDFWSTGSPECLKKRSQAQQPGLLGTFSYGMEALDLGVTSVQGSVLSRSAVVTLHYADGKTTQLPYTWVTAPINAGFFYYAVPAGHSSPRTRPVALTVRAKGRPLARAAIESPPLGSGVVDHRDRWGQDIQVTPEAVWSKRKLLASFNEKDGTFVEFWVMPSRRGSSRRCFVASPFSGGCMPAILTGDPIQLSVIRGSTALLFGQVAANVAAIRLRFQNGDVQQVSPRSGFILMRLDPRNYRPGSRLDKAEAVGSSGQVMFTEKFNPTIRAVYPCAHPKDYGYGVHECP